MASHQVLVFLLQVAVLLLLALCLGRLASRFGLPAVVGELLAGVLLGPSLLAQLAPGFSEWLLPREPAQMHLLDAVSQMAVLLLVGITGVQVDLGVLQRRRRTAIRVSLAGLLVPLALGVATGYVLVDSLMPGGTDRSVFAMFFGVAMCVSAIPVIAKTLTDMGLLHRDVGQLTLAAGTIDDAVGWFLLSIVSAMATAGLHAGSVSLSVLYLVGFVAAAWFIGRPVVRFLLRLATRSTESGVTIAITVVIILLGGVSTHALGMEAVFGAFVAGVLVGTPGAADPARLAPLRTMVQWVLAPLFLASAALRMDLTALRHGEVLVGAIVALFIAVLGKFAGAYIGARTSQLTKWEGLALGAGMNARGVVQMVVATVGLRIGVLDTASYTIILFVAIATSVTAPPLLRMAMARVEHSAEEQLRKSEHDETWSTAEPRPPKCASATPRSAESPPGTSCTSPAKTPPSTPASPT
ncbi:cation:proton antiporter [Streptomyces iconiensis]|uniref:Cation:proton antiporter n=1 Tax=Streptomyces iconiensis TaxID=1384038 RepID=A0ABT7A2Y1_9ACTN|nr:cation:proton antiporter [Streptomyces iconiensis]MDJ1135429.1 cation:proton antiporter [Streptomyces iconiensis]